MGQPQATAEIDLAVQIVAGLGHVGHQLEQLNGHNQRVEVRRRELNAKMVPLNVDLQSIPSSGLLDVPRLLGPPMGWQWQLDSIGVQGFTSGLINVYVNSSSGVNLFSWSAPTAIYQREFRYLRYGERLVFTASGLTGIASVWVSGLAYTEDIQGERHI